LKQSYLKHIIRRESKGGKDGLAVEEGREGEKREEGNKRE
jgi:hypothetical protein